MLSHLLDLVLPRDCAGCGAAGRTLCATCCAALGPPREHRPQPAPSALPLLVAAGSYDGPVRSALLAHKEHGRLGLARPLGRALGEAVRALDAPGALLVPVPSSPQAVRARGHDHARRLAAAAARELGRPYRPLLVQARRTADQSGLGAEQRAANLDRALRARRPLPGLAVVLVDDVATTGATLAEAARALRAAGADVQGAAVVAATVLRSRPRGSGGPATRSGATPVQDRVGGLASTSGHLTGGRRPERR